MNQYPITSTKYAPAGYIQKARYREDNSVALLATDDHGQRLYTATVWLPVKPQINCVWIKTWSENEGVLEALIDSKLVFPTGRIHEVNKYGSKAVEVELQV